MYLFNPKILIFSKMFMLKVFLKKKKEICFSINLIFQRILFSALKTTRRVVGIVIFRLFFFLFRLPFQLLLFRAFLGNLFFICIFIAVWGKSLCRKCQCAYMLTQTQEDVTLLPSFLSRFLFGYVQFWRVYLQLASN